MIGRSISHYEVLEELGRGGMGILYRARDERLERTVAIKVLHADAVSSTDRRQRFIREARAASALNHPHIVTIYDIDRETSDGVEHDFIVMEHVEGMSLDKRLARGPLEVTEAVEWATQIAEALCAAHEAGIVHRDIKPANIMVTTRGEVKLVDFGLAKLTEPLSIDPQSPTRSASLRTQEGTVLGTAAYMSPEQAEGRPVDGRTDVFSFGAVLYEMLTGRRAFEGDSQMTTRLAILSRTPAPLRSLRPEVPAELERVVSRCLERDREGRYASALELLEKLRRARAPLRQSLWARPRVAGPAFLAIAAVVASGGWIWVRSSRVRWAREVARPEIARLAEEQDNVAAFDLAQQARRYLPQDRELERLWNTVSVAKSVRTDPPGAEVSWKAYARPNDAWHALGRTPLDNVRLPAGYLRWRIEKDGYESVERASLTNMAEVTATLHRAGTGPPGMVWVPGGQRTIGGKAVALDGFWLDRFEVTNREFKVFLDAGGYRKREFWKQPFEETGRELGWEEAIQQFLDRTGRPGPATWELGSSPPGEDEYPVRGVSWFEAAAYAEFAGKSLPTIHHWLRATDPLSPSAVVELSNFQDRGPARVGAHQGLGPFGTYDMAGNVKEWCFNASGGKRYTLGGAWNEPVYMYRQAHAQPPFERLETYGFRCVKYLAPPVPELTAAIERTWRDYAREKPVDDATFRVYQSLFAYDHTPLDPAVEHLDSGSPYWRDEKITFNAAYGGERVIAYLSSPTNTASPFQTVVFFPGLSALEVPHHEGPLQQYLDFVIRSGRAVLFPIYQGTYERRLREKPPNTSRAFRDLAIHWYQDLARSVDYLETRKDIDAGKIAYYGFSLGASRGVNFVALEKRFKASILLSGGLDYELFQPEVDPFNFASHVTTPTLMLNGREDFRFPLEESQKPLFRILGTPPEDKRHLVVPGGHVPARLDVIKGVLDWLDRYLGPVERKG
jgi:formylglycine-generating enzyme required for sulfatase activity/dienelactone hydrolase/predicted Ser/Thr protein kinase